MKTIIISIIKIYQNLFSHPLLPRCKYYPNCSEYAAMAIEKDGVLKGMLKSTWRIIRCNPLSRGGLDLP